MKIYFEKLGKVVVKEVDVKNPLESFGKYWGVQAYTGCDLYAPPAMSALYRMRSVLKQITSFCFVCFLNRRSLCQKDQMIQRIRSLSKKRKETRGGNG